MAVHSNASATADPTHIDTVLRLGVGGIGGVITYLFGSETDALLILTVLMVLDYITGLSVALSNGSANSSTGFRGVARKVLMLAVIIVAHFVDVALDAGRPVMAMATTWFFIANESLSVIENAAALGVPVPARLRAALEKVSEDD